MNIPTITIPDPTAVGAWLDHEVPQCHDWKHGVHFRGGVFSTMHWLSPSSYVEACAATPCELLANLRANIAAHDPLAKLRADAKAAGYALMKLPED